MEYHSFVLKVMFVSVSIFTYIPGGHGPGSVRSDKIRVFRAEKSYAVTQGKWYFEFEVVTVGEMRVGWARPSVHADRELGSDDLAYVFNGCRVLQIIIVVLSIRNVLEKHNQASLF